MFSKLKIIFQLLQSGIFDNQKTTDNQKCKQKQKIQPQKAYTNLLLIRMDRGDKLSKEVVKLFTLNETIAISVVVFPHLGVRQCLMNILHLD